MTDLSSIRRLDFPESTEAALDHLAVILGNENAAIPGFGGTDDEFAEGIATEFIFRESPSKHGYVKKTSAVQRLQVVEIVLSLYRRDNVHEWVQHAVFRAMFSATLSPARTDFLAKLVSMAIGVKNKAILDCSAVWMQRHGCCTDVVAVLVTNVVDDYCHLVPNAASGLVVMPQLSPHFCCNFITALTAFYAPTGRKGCQRVLPTDLLHLLTDWVEQDPRLCLVSLCHAQNAFIQPQRSSLWTSPTKPNTQTPIPGLVRWTTQAFLARRLTLLRQGAGTGLPNSQHSEPAEMTAQERRVWSRLHLALLQTLLAFPTLPGANQLELLTLADMTRIVKDVSTSLMEMTRRQGPPSVPAGGDAELQTAIQRLVQLLQVALTTGSFRCSLSDLQNICNNIPPNKLLAILQHHHLARTPPPMHHEGR